jgi:hypothetical protein
VRARLWRAADLRGDALLLDHLIDVRNAMVGFLRHLHGGVVGVFLAVDVEVERERQRMKPWRLGALCVRMPPTSAQRLRQLLWSRCAGPSPAAIWIGRVPARTGDSNHLGNRREMCGLIRAQHGQTIVIMDDELVDRANVLGGSPEGGHRQIESLQ